MHRLDIILGNRGIYIEQICTRNVIVILKTTESNLEPSLSILEVVCLDVEQEVSSGSTGRGWWCSTSRASGVEYPIFSELNLR